jgi:DNA primase
MVNEILLSSLIPILGEGKATSRGNYAFHCPFCNHSKPKLEINFTEHPKGHHPWGCWVCHKKGLKIDILLKKLKISYEKRKEINGFITNASQINNFKENEIEKIQLPKEYKGFITLKKSDIVGKHALKYLKDRGLTKEDIIKYNIGYCDEGYYKNHIIIPSYDENGEINFFTARSFEKEPFRKYKNPPFSRNIIPFEFFINWNLPIILCEGPFDAIAIKRNSIPLFGNNIQENLMKKLITSKVNKIYVALDKDALKLSIKYCEELLNEGKEVYLINMDDKDPSQLGFYKFTKQIQKIKPLTYKNLMAVKLQLI